MKEKRRIFIAIPFLKLLDQKEVLIALGKIRKSIGNSKHLDLRWVKDDYLHITLNFLGYVENGSVPKVEGVIEKILMEEPPFSLKFGEFEWGPSEKFARMIWLRGEFSPEADRIKKKVFSSLLERNIEIKVDYRPFLNHITLARIRKRIGPLPKFKERLDFSLKVNTIELWESVLSNSGAKYFVLRSFSLPETLPE